MIVMCQQCNYVFYKKPAEIKRHPKHYCSRKCASESRKIDKYKTFYDMCFVNNHTDCIEWNGCISKCGYGKVRFNQQVRLAHRVSYHLKDRGFDLDSCLQVLHACDNPKCVNPDHLFLGTHADNMADMHKKLRSNKKLKPIDVFAIRESSLPNIKLAKLHSVSVRTIRYVKQKDINDNYINYSHWMPLPPPPEKQSTFTSE